MVLLESQSDFRWYGAARPQVDRSGAKASGGVGFMVFNRKLRTTLVACDRRGLLAISVTLPGYQPVGIIGVYIPPEGSVFNRQGTDYTTHLLTQTLQLKADMERRHEVVLVVGDLNMRFGNVRGIHATEDAAGKGVGRQRRLLQWCQRLSVAPVHGRPPELVVPRPGTDWRDLAGQVTGIATSQAAKCTSRAVGAPSSVAFTAEVDYILAPLSLPQSRFAAAQPPATVEVSTHRPVAACFMLLQATEDHSRSTLTRPRRVPKAHYSDRSFWDAAAQAQYSKMTSFLAGLKTRSMEANLEGLHAVYRDALELAANRDARPRLNGRSACWGYRRYKGMKLPASISALFEKARQSRNKFTREKNKAVKTRRAKDPPAMGPVSVDLEQARLQWERDSAAARKAAAQHVKRAFRDALQHLESLRITDAHKLQTILDRIAPMDMGIYSGHAQIPEENGRFTSFFRDLLRESRLPASIGGTTTNWKRWERCFPQHDAGTVAQLNEQLTRPFEPLEIQQAIYPVHSDMAEAPNQCPCQLCKPLRDHIRAWSQDRRRVPAPNLRCHVSGGKAPGLSGLATEHIRFGRPVSWTGSLFNWRQHLCKGWSQLFNQFLANGRVPSATSFCSSVLSPIHKKGDKSDPNNYRGIASGDIVPKVFALVLLRRLEHWCESLRVIPANQAGFRAGMSAEHHVFALLEVLKERQRSGIDSFLLFLDLKKAYDSVPQSALWFVLDKLGLPDTFIGLLKDWAAKRVVKVQVNGDLSEELPATKGLPQGDPLSPLLFNLYITVLMREIAVNDTVQGISWPSHSPDTGNKLRLKDLWYADDMVALGRNAADIQALLSIVSEWSKDWGIDVGVGEGKTNAMWIPAERDGAEAAACPPLMIGPAPVPWVSEYRYLGHILNDDLSTSGAAQKLRRLMDAATARYFTYNKAVRSLSIATQLQIAQAQVVGCATYLLGVTPYSDADLRLFDTALHKMARSILATPRYVPNATVAADARLLPAAALVLMHRWRFGQSLRLSRNRDTPAVRIMELLPTLPPSTGPLSSWLTVTRQATRAAEQSSTISLPADAPYQWDVHRLTLCLGRRTAYAKYRNQLATKAGPRVDRTVGTLLTRGRDTRQPTQAHALLHCIGRYDCESAQEAPSTNHRLSYLVTEEDITTPMSAWAAGCDGSPIALSTKLRRSQCRAIQAIRCGRIALAWWPFHFEADSSVQQAAQSLKRKQAFIAADAPCRLCGSGVETPLHLIVACQHEEMVHFRNWLFKQTQHLLRRMDRVLRSAFRSPADGASPVGRTETALPKALEEALSDLTAALKEATMSSDDSKIVMFRLMACAPWSAHDVREAAPDATGGSSNDRAERARAREERRSTAPSQPSVDPSLPLTLAIGRLLDATVHQRSRLRSWANLWTLWSYRAVRRLTAMHGCALGVAKATSSCPVHGDRIEISLGRRSARFDRGTPDPELDIDDSDAYSDASGEEDPSDPASSP